MGRLIAPLDTSVAVLVSPADSGEIAVASLASAVAGDSMLGA
jgi:hypothetical protein